MAHPALAASDEPASDGRDRWILLAVLAAAVLAYATALGGDFVYDDTRQILDNPLIQEPGLAGRALASDVWAFRAPEGEAGSNYWRPTFVAWMIANERLFGLRSFGWHATSLLLHALVTGLVFGFLRRLGLASAVAGAVALLFAVHPVHVESVAWIAGSPDLLLGVGLVGGLWALYEALAAPTRARRMGWGALALGGAAVAVGAKEVGVMVPLLAAGLVALFDPAGGTVRARLAKAGLAALPFAALAALYLGARQRVIGGFVQASSWEHGWAEALLTVPAALLFYVRKLMWPLPLGPMYGLRPVTAEAVGLTTFWGPLALVLAAFALALWLARRGPVQAFGLLLFALLLAPALNLVAFPPEHLVHDRYLYLPLLGALLLVVPTLAEARRPAARGNQRRVALAGRAAAVRPVRRGAVALAVPLAALSAGYSRAWTSEVALWQRAVETDPASSSSWTQLALALRQAGRDAEAEAAVARSVALRPMAPALIEQGDALVRAGRFDEAVRLFEGVREAEPSNPLPYERLGALYIAQGRPAEAEAELRRGLAATRANTCSFASNLGVALYLQGRRPEARAELERAAALAPSDASVACRVALFHLGAWHDEAQQPAEARAAYVRYLELSGALADARSQQLRALAAQRVAALGG